MQPDWTALLVEPKAILGPYKGKAPPLSTFAPYAWRAQFDDVAIAGQFMQLPEQVPPSWGSRDSARAEVVFEFHDVRLFRVDGVLERSDEDDSLHGMPCGMPGQCSIEAAPEAYIDDAERGIFIPWKQFSFTQKSFSLLVEAGHVSIYCGRRASGQFGRCPPY
ncbi:hypothetical protein [Massilia sp. AB1]|uniref:hypothetical protein n=2 Tax=unclassified Massilia TaxID=2609279 RepID=UPI001B84439D|nr:hypothetical protein [Massilia sp. AB1]MBQ5940468.1 hypothetical protein [Massilia sp. AB1]